MVAKRINLYHQIHKFLDDRLSALSEPPPFVLCIVHMRPDMCVGVVLDWYCIVCRLWERR
jgi:hypothetical protein